MTTAGWQPIGCGIGKQVEIGGRTYRLVQVAMGAVARLSRLRRGGNVPLGVFGIDDAGQARALAAARADASGAPGNG